MQEWWSPSSWREKPISQAVSYPDEEELKTVLGKIRQLPPIVTSWEIERLKKRLAKVASGEMFLLQGGDCSERFSDCTPNVVTNKLKILLRMSLILIHSSKKNVVRVGRIAGQYAKPRSSPVETIDGVTLPSYRGDLVNRMQFTEKDRTPDPNRLMRAYGHSAMVLNFIRSLSEGGFSDFRHPEYWELDYIQENDNTGEFKRIVQSINDSVHFLETLVGQTLNDQLRRAEFYTSHEGLVLEYEEANTRLVPRRLDHYNLSTHLPWIGERTRKLDEAHIEYFRGIANPVGVKVGPTMGPEELIELVNRLNPYREPGKLVLIARFGAGQIAEKLPPLVEALQRKCTTPYIWCCDPMHGNTISTANGFKTRDFDDILSELKQAFEIHEDFGSQLGGVHFELTGENVTECLGGARKLQEEDLKRNYESDVDPRLNYEQALEMALLISQRMSQREEREAKKRRK